MYQNYSYLPEKSTHCLGRQCVLFSTKSAFAEEIHLRWMKSLCDEIPLTRGIVEADFISSEAAG